MKSMDARSSNESEIGYEQGCTSNNGCLGNMTYVLYCYTVLAWWKQGCQWDKRHGIQLAGLSDWLVWI